MIIYLYVKQHSITGLKYFGKTIKSDPYKYKGSGKYWLQHIKKYGETHIETVKVWEFSDIQECSEFAIRFSIDNDIVKSNDWANLIIEDALTGGHNVSALLTEKSKQSAIDSRKEKYGIANGQTLNDGAKTKRKNTKLERYGHEMLQCHTLEAKQKRKKTQIEKYGSVWGAANTPESRAKSAAKHKIQLQYKKNRPDVIALQSLSKQLGIKLPKNYWQKSDEFIQCLLDKYQESSDTLLLT